VGDLGIHRNLGICRGGGVAIYGLNDNLIQIFKLNLKNIHNFLYSLKFLASYVDPFILKKKFEKNSIF